MIKITFQEIECYIAYKVLNKDMSNFQNNYTYETNKWYSAHNVDTDTSKYCSYGMNLAKTIEWCVNFDINGIIYKSYVPIENNQVTFIEDEDKFRCKSFFLSNEIVTNENKEYVDKYWPQLTEYQKDRICTNQPLDIDKYWSQLTEYQKDLVCEYQPLDVDKYNLTDIQKQLTEKYKDENIIYSSDKLDFK